MILPPDYLEIIYCETIFWYQMKSLSVWFSEGGYLMIKVSMNSLVIIRIKQVLNLNLCRTFIGAWILAQFKYGEEMSMQDWTSGGAVCCFVSKISLIDITRPKVKSKVKSLSKQFTSKKVPKYCHMGYGVALVPHNICAFSCGELI